MPLDAIGPITDPSLAKEISDFFISRAEDLRAFYGEEAIEQEYIATLTPKAIKRHIKNIKDPKSLKPFTDANYYFVKKDEREVIVGGLRVNLRYNGIWEALTDPVMVSQKREGIGSMLLESMEEYMQKTGAVREFGATVHLRNHPSQALFMSHHYRIEPSTRKGSLYFSKVLS